jgi:predicted O-methyltransferase YrrM
MTIIDQAFDMGMHQHRGEVDALMAYLIPRRHAVNVLEIGSLRGGTMMLWAGVSSGVLVSVDLPDGPFGAKDHGLGRNEMLERNYRLQEMYPTRFFGVLGNSHDQSTLETVRRLVPHVDLLFIDGDHTARGVRLDYEMYAPLVRPGGVIVFHDILDTPLHRAADCRVDVLWHELKRTQSTREFSVNNGWGGIGVVEVPA